jgi:hypothetical protein
MILISRITWVSPVISLRRYLLVKRPAYGPGFFLAHFVYTILRYRKILLSIHIINFYKVIVLMFSLVEYISVLTTIIADRTDACFIDKRVGLSFPLDEQRNFSQFTEGFY